MESLLAQFCSVGLASSWLCRYPDCFSGAPRDSLSCSGDFFFWNNFRFTKKLQRQCRESSCTLIQLPLVLTSYITLLHLSKLSDFHCYDVVIKTKYFIWVWPTFLLMSLFSSRIQIRTLLSFWLPCLLSLLSSVTVSYSLSLFSKSAGQLSCSPPLKLDLCDVFSLFDWSYGFLGKILQRWSASSLQGVNIRRYMTSTCLITGDGNLDHVVKVVSARVLHWKVTLFPFILYLLEGSH